MTFTVLHVCLGNICRSPMAERLLIHRLTQPYVEQGVGGMENSARIAELVRSHSVGTGDWHVGMPMDPGSVRQLERLGASSADFQARTLAPEHLTQSHLILTATHVHAKAAAHAAPRTVDRVFVLRHFGRLAALVDPAELPPYAPTPSAVMARGQALVAAANRLRADQPLQPTDDLTDPYYADDQVFAQVADGIDEALAPLVRVLTA